MNIEGYVEVDASLWGVGVLEAGLRSYLDTDPAVIYHGRTDERLGTVTKISGRGDRIEITATLDQPDQQTSLADSWNKIKSGTVKGLSLIGVFTRDRAEVAAFSIAPLTPVPGTGFVTKVST
jgi:hypothetical protein